MSTMFTKRTPSGGMLVRAIHNAGSILSVIGTTFCLSASAAYASDYTLQPPAHSGHSTWGSGPIEVSLLESARREPPVRGVESDASAAQSVGPLPLALPIPHVAVVQSIDARMRV